jgi:hypothetical protein
MAKVIDFDKSKERHVHDRKDERADALRRRFQAAREEAARQDPLQRAKAARRLLDLFKNPPDKES